MLKKIEAHQGGLASLPRDGDLIGTLRFDHLLDVCLENIVRHAKFTSWVKGVLRQKEAVLTVEIADCTRRFGEYVEVRRRIARPYFRRLGHVSYFGQGVFKHRWRLAATANPPGSRKHEQLGKVIGILNRD